MFDVERVGGQPSIFKASMFEVAGFSGKPSAFCCLLCRGLRPIFFLEICCSTMLTKHMDSALLISMIAGFATTIVGMLGLSYATLRSAAVTRLESRADFERLYSKIEAQGARLDSKIEEQGNRLDARIDNLRSELREEMHAGFSRMHSDYRDVRNRLDRLTDSLALRGLKLEPEDSAVSIGWSDYLTVYELRSRT